VVNSNVVLEGRRLVTRVVLVQTASAMIVACVSWALAGGAAGAAALAGGMIAAVGSAVLGWRMFSPGVAPAAALRRAMYSGEGLKWLWYVLAIYAALARLKLAPLPLLMGLLVAQFCYWVGLIGSKRGK
jgi:F0F1-type ATP synthase assembly protein I